MITLCNYVFAWKPCVPGCQGPNVASPTGRAFRVQKIQGRIAFRIAAFLMCQNEPCRVTLRAQGSECTLPLDENADRSLMSARVMQAKDSKRGPSVCCCHKLSRVCILFGASLPFDPSVGMVEVPSLKRPAGEHATTYHDNCLSLQQGKHITPHVLCLDT